MDDSKPKIRPVGMGLRRCYGMSREAFATILENISEEKLRAALEAGEIEHDNEAQAREWLNRKQDASVEALRQEEAARRDKELQIAERSAQAAEKSARWAGFAVAISVAALLFSAIPYMK